MRKAARLENSCWGECSLNTPLLLSDVLRTWEITYRREEETESK